MNNPQSPIVSGLELWQWRSLAKEQAIASDISPAEVDWLLQEVANLDRLALRLELFKHRPEIELKIPLPKLIQLWQQRINARMPVQYLTEVAPWRNFSLTVSPAVLIPRPETELLIDIAVEAVGGRREEKGGDGGRINSLLTQNSKFYQSKIQNPKSKIEEHWVDLGTGSGAIALGLAEVFPEATIHAVDRSSNALNIARSNAEKLGFAQRINFYQGNWWEPIQHLKGELSGMVSNPPYIPSSLVPQLQPEVALHEPHIALDGGADGLDYICYLVETAPAYLCSGGIWLIEMMAGQANIVAELLSNQGSYCNIQIFADLAGIDRFALAYRV